jgi:hypothetical protein
MGAPRYSVRQPFDYAGGSYDRGQIIMLVGAKNDEKLIRLGYVTELDRRTTTYECAACGATFIGIAERTAHGNKRHIVRVLSPEEEDARAESEERQLDQIAPLYLENTAASARG